MQQRIKEFICKQNMRLIIVTLLVSFIFLTANNVWASEVPRIILFQSAHPLYKDQICLGHVMAENTGFPTRVLNFAGVVSGFCKADIQAFEQGNYLSLIEDISYNFSTLLNSKNTVVEIISPHQLSQRIFSPLPISQRELDSEQVYVIGVGFNYEQHRQDTQDANIVLNIDDLLIFPKSLVPSKPYGIIEKGLQIDIEQAEDVLLMDYEAELGLVLLQEIDLKKPLSKQLFYEGLGYFVSNDISDRKPIIEDLESGYTQGKTHPGYLPTGPWLIPSRYMPNLFTVAENAPLELELNIETDHNMSLRQKSTTDLMRYKPDQIIELLSRHYQTGMRICMRDARGVARFVYSENGIIPAGSIILTGTPGGTAIKQPNWFNKILLFIEGGFSLQGAKEEYIEKQQSDSKNIGFLQEKDIMYTQISHLGTQRHTIQKTTQRSVYGNAILKGDCSYPIAKGHKQ